MRRTPLNERWLQSHEACAPRRQPLQRPPLPPPERRQPRSHWRTKFCAQILELNPGYPPDYWVRVLRGAETRVPPGSTRTRAGVLPPPLLVLSGHAASLISY